MSVLEPAYSYQSVIDVSERVTWSIKQLFPPDTKIDFTRPHLPEALALTEQIGCLDADAKRKLNHIRGHSYMNLFGFVEEYIIAQILGHAQGELFGDHDAVRALLRFGEEELKHQKLFRLYCAAFERDFPTPCRVLQHAAAVASVILSNSAAAVLLATLHLELMTQQHYVDCVKDDADLDPLFSNILKHHWLEEAQHAKLDVLELGKLAATLSETELDRAFEEYFGIVAALDGLLVQQVDFDIESLEMAIDRHFTAEERTEIRRIQSRSYRRDFIVMGMTNPAFLTTLRKLSPAAAERARAEAAKYGAA